MPDNIRTLLLLLSILSFTQAFDGKVVNLRRRVHNQYSSSVIYPNENMNDLIYNDIIQVDFSSYSTDLAIALYTSNTILNYECENFETFDCIEQYSCEREKTNFSNELPYFTATGTTIHVKLSFDEDWYFPYNETIQYMATCTGGNQNTYDYAAGILGFGVNGSFQNNFIGTQRFSFDVTDDETYLLFGYDPTLHTSDEPIEISTNQDWNGAYESIYAGGNYYNPEQVSQIIFDLGMNYIGVPVGAFENILEWFRDSGLTCSQKATQSLQAECTLEYGYHYNDLPALEIVQVNGSNIVIPATVYLSNSSYSGRFFLNIVPTSSDPTSNQMMVTSSYANAIILGIPVMTYYYAVFDFEASPVIKLFISGANQPVPPTPNSSGKLAFVLAGSILGFLLLITTCLCCCAKKKKQAPTKTVPKTTDADASVYVAPEVTKPSENRSMTNTIISSSVVDDPFNQPERVISTNWAPAYNPHVQIPAQYPSLTSNQYQPPAQHGYYNQLLM